MEKREMFLPLKLTLQKHNINKIIFVVAISISLVGLVSVAIQDSCEVQHIDILTDINEYEQTLDPDFCYSLLDRIDSFNGQCDLYIEILDCG